MMGREPLSDMGSVTVQVRVPAEWMSRLKAGAGVSANVRAALEAWLGLGRKPDVKVQTAHHPTCGCGACKAKRETLVRE